MFRTCLLFLTVIIITAEISVSDNNTNTCVTYLYELEVSLKSNPLNIESIDDGFFLPNQSPSKWVIVNIYYNISTDHHDVFTTHPNGFGDNSFNDAPDYWHLYLCILIYKS